MNFKKQNILLTSYDPIDKDTEVSKRLGYIDNDIIIENLFILI